MLCDVLWYAMYQGPTYEYDCGAVLSTVIYELANLLVKTGASVIRIMRKRGFQRRAEYAQGR